MARNTLKLTRRNRIRIKQVVIPVLVNWTVFSMIYSKLDSTTKVCFDYVQLIYYATV